jgi:hypothetical protein
MTLSPAAPNPGSISGLVTRLRNLGVDVAITELDVPLGPARTEQAQVAIYRQVATECLVAGCSEITVWGVGDGFTTLDSDGQRANNPFLSAFFSLPSKPLLLDTNLQPKAAYAAVVETIASTGAIPRPVGDLQTGVIFWRALGRVGSALGTETSATWQFTVGPRSAPVDTSWGSRLDVNGDGYADVVVSAPSTNRVFIYVGGAAGVGVTPTTTLTRPDGGFGHSIASAGDTNGDGYADLIVGAYVNSRAYVYLGGAAGLVDAPAATLVGPDAGQFGLSVAGAGDVNGDGFADVVVGANLAVSSTGRAYVYLGASSGVSTTPSAILTGPDGVNGGFGSRVASAGDANGDGYADLLVGSFYSDPGGNVDAGRSYVVFGGSNRSSMNVSAVALTSSTVGYVIRGESGGDLAGRLSYAGDVNGDGLADMIVGAAGASCASSSGG